MVSTLFELVQDAIPNSDNKVFLADPGNNPSRYIMNNAELAKWTPIQKHYYVDAPPSVSGLKVRFAEPYLSSLFSKTVWTSEEFALPHFRRSEGYNEFLRPLGFDHMLWVTLTDAGERVGSYPIWRSTDMPPFSQGDIEFMNRAAPHIAHAIKVASLARPLCSVPGCEFMPETDGRTGVVILNQAGKVCALDRTAEEIFSEIGILEGVRADMVAPGRASALFEYITRTLQAIFRETKLIPDPDTPALRIYSHRTGIVLKLHGVMTRGADGRERVTVLLERGELRSHRRSRMAVRLGLCASDIAILDGLRAGLHGAAMAERMQIAPGTLKVYMSRLAEKLTPNGGIEELRRFASKAWA